MLDVKKTILWTCFFFVLACMFPLLSAAEKSKKLELERAPYSDAVYIGNITSGDVSEASGLAASHRNKDVLWIINDGGNKPKVHAINFNGQYLGSARIQDVENIDWEDLASFSYRNNSYLLIADVGDNKAKRVTCLLHVIKEPVINHGTLKKKVKVDVAWSIHFRYQDGPRDCESVAVDVKNNQVLLLSKRTSPPVLYAVPLLPKGDESVVIANRITPITTLPQKTNGELKHWFNMFSNQPTAMDLSTDGTKLVILTYKHAYLYLRKQTENWTQCLSRQPQIIDLPSPALRILYQREALCFTPDTRQIFITSEGTPTPLFRLDLKLTGNQH